MKKMTKNWNIPVSEELDQKAMVAAHQSLVTKAEYIRRAVAEKIKNDSGIKTKILKKQI